MNNTRNYTINFETEEIIITKKFGKAASQIGTAENKLLQQLRKEFEGFKIVYKTIDKKENKKSYKGLSIEEMERFVAGRSEEELTLFKKVKEVASSKQGKYAIIKKWFLDKYKEEYNRELENLKVA